jgi:putative flippase GtrA
MFVVNDHWTFAEQPGRDSALRRLLTSNTVRLAGLATGTGILLVLHGLGVWYVAANAVGLGVGFVVNYAFESLVTWQVLD